MTATRHAGSAAEQRALDVYVKLHRCTDVLRARSTQFFAEHGLSYSQFAALEVLYHVGPLCQRDIAAKVLKSGGNLTMVIDNLEKAGLVERRPAAQDRRQKVVRLTAKGRKLIAGIFPEHAARITEAVAVLSAREQEQLARLCRKLGLSLA
jgi:MarR family 2-MHQ and catechol resistance regulon transcriptional repressor